jgi:hypothetical protein
MGGRGSSSGISKRSAGVFDIADAKRTYDRGLGEKGIPVPTGKDIQIKVGTKDRGQDIVFQFRLTANNEMSIRAYDPNQPDKAKVSVTTKDASLDSVIKDKNSSNKDKVNARKIKEMINQTTSGITQGSLMKIANDLIMHKGNSRR